MDEVSPDSYGNPGPEREVSSAEGATTGDRSDGVHEYRVVSMGVRANAFDVRIRDEDSVQALRGEPAVHPPAVRGCEQNAAAEHGREVDAGGSPVGLPARRSTGQ